MHIFLQENTKLNPLLLSECFLKKSNLYLLTISRNA